MLHLPKLIYGTFRLLGIVRMKLRDEDEEKVYIYFGSHKTTPFDA